MRHLKSDLQIKFLAFCELYIRYRTSKRFQRFEAQVFESWLFRVDQKRRQRSFCLNPSQNEGVFRRIEEACFKLRTYWTLQNTFDRFKRYTTDQKLLSFTTILRIWQQKSLVAFSIFAWMDEFTLMWYVNCFRVWKDFAIRRIQWTLFLTEHGLKAPIERARRCLDIWRKTVHEKESDSDDENSIAFSALNSTRAFLWRRPILRNEIMKSIPKKKRPTKRSIFETVSVLTEMEYRISNETVIPTFYRHDPDNAARKLLYDPSI